MNYTPLHAYTPSLSCSVCKRMFKHEKKHQVFLAHVSHPHWQLCSACMSEYSLSS